MEHSQVWRPQQWSGVELLAAKFTRFEFAKHWHDELAIGVIEQGAEGLHYQGQKLLVPQRHIVAINAAEVHTGFAGSEQGWTYRMFYFDTEILQRWLGPQLPQFSPTLQHSIVQDDELFLCLQQLHQAWQYGSLLLSQQSLLCTTLVTLFQRYGGHYATTDGTAGVTASMSLARDYLHQHWRDNIGSEVLEQLTGLSRFQLIRQFKQQYGMAPHQYLLALKVRHARHMLLQGYSSADIAVTCGFYDQSHFSRNFKKTLGVPPARYAAAS